MKTHQLVVIGLYRYWCLQVRRNTIVCVCVCVFSTDTRRGQRLQVLSLNSCIKQRWEWTRGNWPTHSGAVRDSYFEDRGDNYFEGQKRLVKIRKNKIRSSMRLLFVLFRLNYFLLHCGDIFTLWGSMVWSRYVGLLWGYQVKWFDPDM